MKDKVSISGILLFIYKLITFKILTDKMPIKK